MTLLCKNGTINNRSIEEFHGDMFAFAFNKAISEAQSLNPTFKHYYKNNHRSEGIRIVNASTAVIIFCKSRPLNWPFEDNNNTKETK